MNRRYTTRATLILLLIAAPLLLAGCATQAESPGDALSSALDAANDGDYDTLESYYSDDMHQQARGGIIAMFGGSDGFAQYYTRSGQLDEVEVTDEHTEDDRARVEATLHYHNTTEWGAWNYGDGSTAEDSVWNRGTTEVRTKTCH